MKTHSSRAFLCLLLAVALTSLPARAETSVTSTSRGWLSGLGVVLLGVGVAGIGLGFGGLVSLGEVNASINAYFRTGAPPADEAGIVRVLRDQQSASSAAMVSGFVLGGLAAVGGIVCLVLDKPVSVAFAPAPGGGGLVVSAKF